MAKIVPAYSDNQGNLYPTPDQAALADLSMVLGRIGAESGITSGLAKCIIEKRLEIEAVFADLDAMTPIFPEPMVMEFRNGGANG